MKTKKNKNLKEQTIAQVENPEIVANATEVTNPNPNEEVSVRDKLETIAGKKKDNKKSKKAKVEEIPAAKTKKKKDKVIKEVADKQKASIKESVVSQRDVKYYYPSDEALREKYPDCTHMSISDLKKKWRQATRNEYRSLEREMNKFIMDQASKEYKAAKKAFDQFCKEHLKPGMAI